MTKLVAKILAVLLTVAVFMTAPVVGQAATHIIPLSNLGYEEDVVVNGALSHTTINIPLPATAVLPGSVVNVSIEPCQQLSGASRLMFYLDNQLASTVNAAQLRANPMVRLPVPAGLKGGQLLRLDIKASLFATGDLAADRINGYLYYTVKNSSNLTLNYNPAAVKSVDAFFSRPHNGMVVIVPDNPTLDEVAAGSWVYGMLQKSFPHQQVKLAAAGERNQFQGYSRIWVAAWRHLPAALAGATGGITLADPDTVVITAADDAGLKVEARRLKALLTKDMPPAVGLTAASEVGKAVIDKNKEVVFFGQQTPREGIMSVPIEFDIFPAMLADAPRRLAFHLEGRYSAGYDKQPRLDVLFNGSLIHSEVLDGSGRVARDVLLPRSAALGARNVLRVEFNYPDANLLNLNGPVQSAQILDSSYFTGIGAFPADRYSWTSIGLLANKPGFVLLGNRPSTASVKGAAEAVYLLNRQLPPGEFAFPEFKPLMEFKTLGTNIPYMFVVGTTGDIPEELLAIMPWRKAKDGTVYANGRNLIVGQVGRYQDVPVIMVTAAGENAKLAETLRQVGSKRSYGKLAGNIFVADEAGALTAVDSRDKSVMLGFFQQDWLDNSINLWRQALRWIERHQQPLIVILGIIVATVIITRLLSGWKDGKSGRHGKGHKPSALAENSAEEANSKPGRPEETI